MENSIDNLNSIFSGLKLDARCVGYEENKHMAFYDIKLNPGCRVRKIESLAPEIALCLRSHTEPIVKTILDKGIVRLHVTIKDSKILDFHSVYCIDDKPKDAFLPFLLGETDEGKLLWTDMSKNPHMLVAGGTGSGKSVFLHLLISNIQKLIQNNDNINLYLSDPKRVEFDRYQNRKEMFGIESICNSYDETINMLRLIETKMENRYRAMCQMKISKIEEAPESFSKIFVIIDEVSDLMMMDKKHKTFEILISRLAQKARAAGIYLVLATQRPSVDVLTGTIKANFPARVSCKVSSKIDSKVILDRSGGEALLGKGDSIIKNSDNDYVRFQAAYSL